MNSIIDSDQGWARDWCWQYCHSSQMDKRIDDFVDPCSAEIWEEPRDDHWDDENDGPQLWTKLIADDDVSFAFESCYDSYHMKIPEIHSSYSRSPKIDTFYENSRNFQNSKIFGKA